MAIVPAAATTLPTTHGPDRKNRDTSHLFPEKDKSNTVKRVEDIRRALPEKIYSFFAPAGEKVNFMSPIYFTQDMEVLRSDSPRRIPIALGVEVLEYDGYETVGGQKGHADFFVTTLKINRFEPWKEIFAKYPSFTPPEAVGGEDTQVVTMVLHEAHMKEANYHFYLNQRELAELSPEGLKAFYEMKAYTEFYNKYKDQIYTSGSQAQMLYAALNYAKPEGKLYDTQQYETFSDQGKDWKLVKEKNVLAKLVHSTYARYFESATGAKGVYVEGDNFEKETKHQQLIQYNVPEAVWKWLSPYNSDIGTEVIVYKYAPKADASAKGAEPIESHVYVHMTECKVNNYVPLQRFFEGELKDSKYKLYLPSSISEVKHLIEVKAYESNGTQKTDVWTSGQRVLDASEAGYKAYLDIRALRLLAQHPDFKPGSDAEKAYNTIVEGLNKEKAAGNKLSDIEAYNKPFDSSNLPKEVWTSGFNKFILAVTDSIHIFHKTPS